MRRRDRLTTLFSILLLLLPVFLCGCDGAYYAAMEAIGTHKRDILTRRIEDGTKQIDKVKKNFQTLDAELQKVSNVNDSKVEPLYKKLCGQYKKCRSESLDLQRRVKEIRKVGKALFREWENELDEYTNEKLRRSSEQYMNKRRKRYLETIHLFKSAQEYTDPALNSISDIILFVKHNLNARAPASIEEELATVNQRMSVLMERLQLAYDEGKKFVLEMDIEKEAEK